MKDKLFKRSFAEMTERMKRKLQASTSNLKTIIAIKDFEFKGLFKEYTILFFYILDLNKIF